MPAVNATRSLRKFLIATLMFLFSCAIAPALSAQTFPVLYTFTGGTDGGTPYEGLFLDSAGNLYGTTFYGGTGSCSQYGLNGCGTVFSVTEQGTESVLYSFQGGSDGQYPFGGVVEHDGYLYGTTVNGGIGYGYGTVFRVNKSGHEEILHRFTHGTDGGYPYATPTFDSAGHLYGTNTTFGDGNCDNAGCGTLFSLYNGEGATIHRFTGAPSDGVDPGHGPVLIDSSGNLYGATAEGGTSNFGAVYKLDRNGNYSILYSFTGLNDGCEPLGNLAIDENGNLYGAASACGYFGKGTLFELSGTGSLTVLYTFGAEAADGNAPMGGVTRDSKGNLYGTTLFGGGQCGISESGCGTVYKLNSRGIIHYLHSFNGTTDGAAPWCNVILDAAGNLYGTTTLGAPNGAGTVWKVAP